MGPSRNARKAASRGSTSGTRAKLRVPPGLPGPSLSQAESPGDLAIQCLVTLFRHTSRVFKKASAAAVNEEIYTAGGFGGHFRLCLI